MGTLDAPLYLALFDSSLLFASLASGTIYYHSIFTLFSLRPGRFLVVESNRQIAQHPNYNEVTLKVYGDTYVSFRTLAQS
ncbi:hypothetical protein AXFE_31970 [Acidithrix ferrooxidans]|uniref:Uncharacterized protein n=1 Tax=Acidithrix ferrooxidans TaxID=1280514 RepID=A0A0D8HDE7_9ACTN|nr:hypothetical protein AXFE_31970 [Acidithrix ferrooxidans]